MKKITIKEIQNILGYKIEIVDEKEQIAEIGDIVEIGGVEWIVLDKDLHGNVLCLTKDFVYKNTRFDGSSNNYANSEIRKKLNGEFLNKLKKSISEDDIIDVEIDLTSDDGLDDYGNVIDKIGLLTADMYRKYNRMIEKYTVDDWWWIATPWSTKYRGSDSSVRCVCNYGTLCNYDRFGYSGVRPFCIFSSSIFKS